VNRGARLCMEEILSAADYEFPRRRQLRIRKAKDWPARPR